MSQVDFMKPPLLTPRQQQAAGVAAGVAVGGSVAAGTAYGVKKGVDAVGRASPVAGRVLARGLPILGLGLVALGAGAAAIKAAREGRSAGEVAKAAALGALGLDDLVMSAQAQQAAKLKKKQRSEFDDPPPGSESDAGYQKRAAAHSREQAKAATTREGRQLWENRALGYEARAEKLERDKGGAGQPAAPAAAASPRSPFDERRAVAKDEIRRTQDLLDIEFKQRGGKGPKFDGLQQKLDKAKQELKQVDEDEAKAPSPWKTGMMLGISVGAGVVGAGLGMLSGRAAKKAAEAAAGAGTRGVEVLAQRANRLTKAAPQGVIAGTVAGDKAAAAVAAAQVTLARKPIGAVQAYGIPLLSGAVGAGSIHASTKVEDPNLSVALRTEGIVTSVAGIVGMKGAMTARQIRSVVTPQAAANLAAASNRLVRERVSGPAAVAQGAARVTAARSRKAAGVAEASQRAVVGKAQARGQAAVVGARAGAAKAQIAATAGVARTAIRAGSGVQIAKVRGESGIVMAQIAAKRSQARAAEAAASPANPIGGMPQYKNVWQDRNGRTYHRRDMSVRTRRNRTTTARRAANDR